MSRRNITGPWCDIEDCEVPAVVEYFVRWTDRHQHYNVWRACLDHQTRVQFNLMTGKWSGGVHPVEMHTTDISPRPS